MKGASTMTTKKQTAAKATTRKSPKEKAATAKAKMAIATDAEDATSAPMLAEGEEIATEVNEAPAPHTVAHSPTGLTLAGLADAYINALGTVGKGLGTQLSYRLDLSVALKALGEETRLDELTEEKVTAFFESATVTKTRTGNAKAQVSIDKTRRVLRQALAYAVKEGHIATTPVAQIYSNRKGKETA
jgi:site-specific recombinase XerC